MPARSSIVALLTLTAGHALAQPHEVVDQPPRRPATRTSHPFFDGPGFVQVNINASGLNIVGDAANEPSMTMDPTAPNRLAVGWRQFNTISSNFRLAGRAHSLDGGRTWINPGPLTPGIFRTDPVLDTTSSGQFFYYSLTGASLTNCHMFSSINRGVSWSNPVSALGGDKNWFAIDRWSGNNHIYLLWSPFFSCCGPAIFGRSTNLGLSYEPAFVVPESPYFGTIAVGSAGEVYITGTRSAGGQIAFVRSTNAANPGATPTFDLTRLVNLGGLPQANTGTGPNPGGLNGQVWVAADPRKLPNRPVYLFCTVNPPTTDPADCYLARSMDGGQTWSPPIRVNDDVEGPNNWQWMGTFAVAPNGRLDAVWIDTRETLLPNMGRLYYSFSTDTGLTWSPNVPITPTWNSFVGWPQQSKIGDYYQLVSDQVGANLIFAATFNGEQDVYFLRIGDRDCNRNGIPDTADLASGTLHDCDGDDIPDECELAAGVPVPCACYANCDLSTSTPRLTPNDFLCFINAYSTGTLYANCDASTSEPALTANDYLCFINAYALGCT